MSPLELVMPVGGVALILLVVWLTGGLRSASLADAASVRDLLAASHPGVAYDDIAVAADRRSAVAVAASGREAVLVLAVGDRITTRIIAPGDLAAVRSIGETVLVTFADLGVRRVRMTLEKTGRAERLAARLQGFLAARPRLAQAAAS